MDPAHFPFLETRFVVFDSYLASSSSEKFHLFTRSLHGGKAPGTLCYTPLSLHDTGFVFFEVVIHNVRRSDSKYSKSLCN